jgi:hypothetical protein
MYRLICCSNLVLFLDLLLVVLGVVIMTRPYLFMIPH